MKKANKESGFTLLELLLVVGVGALLIIGGIATYRMVVEGNRVNDSVRMLLTIKQEAQKLYQGQNSYNGISTDILKNIHAMPQNGLNPFNSEIVIAAAPANGVADAGFSVEFPNVPSSACMRLGKTITDPADVEQIDVGGTAIDHDDILDQDFDWIGALSTGCGTDTVANIVWTFR